jgi:hypothetical protein
VEQADSDGQQSLHNGKYKKKNSNERKVRKTEIENVGENPDRFIVR